MDGWLRDKRKIVVACDSFKGCMSSKEAGQCIAEAIREIRKDVETDVVAVGDGGEGTLEAIWLSAGMERRSAAVPGPLGNSVEAHYLISGRKAVVELAQACGLGLVAPSERRPLEANTFGLGRLIRHVADSGCDDLVVLLGGSATTDGGAGMLSAMGWRFLRSDGSEIYDVRPCDLPLIARVDGSRVPDSVRRLRIRVACDVDNPFCGPRGAARVFAPQKGATPAEVDFLDSALQHFARVLIEAGGCDVSLMPGAGAAGGTAGALCALSGAQLVPGGPLVLDTIGFDHRLCGADLVITGEGRMDSQTLGGKLPVAVLRAARRHGIPVMAVAGSISDRFALEEAGFGRLVSVTPPGQPPAEAMRPATAAANIRRALRALPQ